MLTFIFSNANSEAKVLQKQLMDLNILQLKFLFNFGLKAN